MLLVYYLPLLFDAGLFDDGGRLLGSASSPIQIWKDRDCVEVIND